MKKIDAQQIIDMCYSLAKHYEQGDTMRWPFIAGCLETKIRELVNIVNQDSEIINDMSLDLYKGQ